MKRIFVIIAAFLLAVVFYQVSNAAPINIILEESYYHVHGDAASCEPDDPLSNFFSFDLSSTDTPLDVNYSGEKNGFDWHLNASAYQFGVQAMTGHTGTPGVDTISYSMAEWTFIPIVNVAQLDFNFDFGSWQSGGTDLRLLDTETELVVLSNHYNFMDFFDPELPGPFPASIECDLLAGHSYSLYMATYSGSGQGGWATGNWLNVQTVPEPATMLLLGLGLIGLAGVRRKLKH